MLPAYAPLPSTNLNKSPKRTPAGGRRSSVAGKALEFVKRFVS
jgi:hypothetical protein